MTHKDKWGSASTRVSTVENAKNINMYGALLHARQKERLEDITVSEYKKIVGTYFRIIRENILEGKDYYIGNMGSLIIRFKKRISTNRIKGYYKEVHSQFLDKVLTFTFVRNERGKDNLDLIKFIWRRDVRREAMNNVIHKGYESIYLMKTKNDRKIKVDRKFNF